MKLKATPLKQLEMKRTITRWNPSRKATAK